MVDADFAAAPLISSDHDGDVDDGEQRDRRAEPIGGIEITRRGVIQGPGFGVAGRVFRRFPVAELAADVGARLVSRTGRDCEDTGTISERPMKMHIITVAVASLLAGTALAQSQASDLERCEALNTLWERHLGKRGEAQQTTNLEAKGAIDQCRRGNTAEGIRALEKVLRANGFKI